MTEDLPVAGRERQAEDDSLELDEASERTAGGGRIATRRESVHVRPNFGSQRDEEAAAHWRVFGADPMSVAEVEAELSDDRGAEPSADARPDDKGGSSPSGSTKRNARAGAKKSPAPIR